MPSTKVSLSKVDRQRNGRRIRTDWTIRWFDEMNRRRSKTIGVVGKLSVRDAKAIQRKFQAEMDGTREQNLTADKAPTITLEEFALTLLGDPKAQVPVVGWLEPKRDRKTIRLYRQAVHHVQKALGKHIRLKDITPVHVDRVWQHVLGLGLAVAPARKTCVQFRAFLNFAKNKPFGILRTNPFTDYDFGEPIAKDPRPLTDEGAIALVAVAPDQWWKAYLRILLKTGLRRTEALMLRWEDVDQAKLM